MSEHIRRKKLIEVALPLEQINPEAVRQKKKAPKGYPTSLHKWWAQRPLATCRAVIFSQLVDDPSAWPDRFPSEADQRTERERLHRLIAALVPWSASNNEHILNAARWEIARSVAWGHGEQPPPKSKPNEILDYLQKKAPPVYDPFSGGGSIPMEAQRLGLKAYGSDLNPVATLISKALIEIPPRFSGSPPVNPNSDELRKWKGSAGLADDVRYYGQWMREEAERRVGNMYPPASLLEGNEAKVVAWIWARTVASPDPMVQGAHVPLVSSFVLSAKKNSNAWAEVVRDPTATDGWRFEVKAGSLSKDEYTRLQKGTKTGRGSNFVCVLTGAPISANYVKAEAERGGLATRMMAVVAEGERNRLYLSPTAEHEAAAEIDAPEAAEFSVNLPDNPRWFSPPDYGMPTYRDLFTKRQMTALLAFSDLVGAARDRAFVDASIADLPDDDLSLAEGGKGAKAYADAVATYLAFVVDRMAMYGSTQATWLPKDNAIRSAYNRQAIPMTWDFAEANVFTKSSGAADTCIGVVAACLDAMNSVGFGSVLNANAANGIGLNEVAPVISTDPPYYDNVGYSDLSDYFYLWLRRSLRGVWPGLFRRLTAPKGEELVATPYRHGGQSNAEAFFLDGMRHALQNIVSIANEENPVSIYYAFKQSEVADEGLTSPGWATFLQAVFDAGLVIVGTWPVRSEGEVRMNSNSANALASSIVLVCRKRAENAVTATRREFMTRLKLELPEALKRIREAGVGPVDMAQSSLGPGIGIFTSYSNVLEPNDSEMTVRTAIALVNEVREEILGEEDAHYDAETRFCIDWFQAFGMEKHGSGDAINMANAYNLGLSDLEQAGVFHAQSGTAQLVRRSEMPTDWRPSSDKTLTHWECTQHLIRILESEEGSTADAASLIAEMSPEDADAARALAYRLYDVCEKKGWAQEAKAYNLLAEEFPHLEQAALEVELNVGPAQGSLDLQETRQ
ncbi:DUF1156 domain-containing protein [Cognatiyoonia sp. IB215182]|uniref:DUF1156 domain-containing protein n=1 Tax=Cognatiyoonia sp. IB215182 TaxID=3097353 RepID=UPI002A124B7B|nr:DUF1156 domain-containing protein [Cognatiyoonia sp. IB215182]MDX8354872.1 DUF1156 domain-containing protein [Cognatiyoonia sp. IB215182]